MKKFTTKAITAAILSSLSLSAAADLYQVEEVPTADNFRHSFPRDINAQNFVVGISRLPETAEIDFERLGIEDPESLTDEEIVNLIQSLANESTSTAQQQRIGLNQAFYFDTTTQAVEPISPAGEQWEGSTDSFFYGINNANSAVGYSTAPYELIEYTYTDSNDAEQTVEYFVSDFITRGVWFNNGEVTQVTAPETEYLGGETALMDINDSGLAAGYASVAVSPFAQERIAECTPEDEEAIVTKPVQVCAWETWFSLKNSTANNIEPFRYSFYARRSSGSFGTNRSIYDVRGFLWQLDASGNVIGEPQELGTLMPREEDDENDFSSYAYTVNNNGIAGGQSWTYHPDLGAIKMPAIFIEGDALPVTDDTKYRWGSVNDVNDNNVATGYLAEIISSKLRTTGFIYSIDNEELTTLPGFFTGSSTVANAINSDGIVVGTGEIEATLAARDRAGFMFDTTEEGAEFINLNNTISCDAPYNIIEANSINDSGVIVATALKAEEYTDSDGETQTRDVVVTLKLDPSAADGELNDCTEQENLVERQGASLGFGSLLGFISLGALISVFRRKSKINS
ncbi:DUF3466 family protein [Idiomarina piscisalsi]|uniref:DUF3466 family protein n=1 Tax=Idiomarina piscisalsi TaxID=1096243 RepID=UPI0013863E23|nr:DUF3466 family protein [Idiomarina piscisalsi]MTJ01233.1 DUF3466 family protein [Idiomarina piscisalsi]